MARPRSELIDELASDLAPTRGPRRTESLAALWLLASWALVVLVATREAPLREDWLAQLASHPRFLFESLLGWAAGAAAIVGAFQLAVPAPGRPVRRLWLPLLLLALWVGAYLLDLVAPALDPSMEGKREGCWIQVLLYGTPPLLLALGLLRRLAPLDRAWTGAVAGAAAGAVPALLMQLACMYVPGHILTHHLAPVLGLAAAGAALGALSLRRL